MTCLDERLLSSNGNSWEEALEMFRIKIPPLCPQLRYGNPFGVQKYDSLTLLPQILDKIHPRINLGFVYEIFTKHQLQNARPCHMVQAMQI